jgi:1-deoxy-D-xylulose-5-phosphate synthase
LRYPRGTGTGVTLDDAKAPIEVGKAELVCGGQTPDDILIIAIGRTVEEAAEARHILKEEHDMTATVINARFVKPLDIDLIGSYAVRIPYIITVEENTLPGGFGSAVLEALSDANINGFKIKRLGIDDVFVDHGSQKLLRRLYGVDAAAIVDAALKLVA